MSAKTSTARRNEETVPVRRGFRLSTPAVMGLVVLGLGFTTVAFPTMIVFVVGMVPTLVCFIVDMTPGRFALRCVAATNFAGVAPYLRTLWSHGHEVSNAMAIIADPIAWLVFYSAAAFGWALFYSVPGLVTAVQSLSADRRVNNLRARQNALIEEWGDEIAGESWRSDEDAPESDADAGPER